jgi:hypothetical protein
MSVSFGDKLRAAIGSCQSNIILWVAPESTRLPLPIQVYDEPLLPLGKALINATRDLVCGYMYELPHYLAYGAAGVIALERTINYVNRDLIRILHGGFALPTYSKLWDKTSLPVDAITVVGDSMFSGVNPNRAMFLLREEAIVDLPAGMGQLQPGAHALRFHHLEQGIITVRAETDSIVYSGLGDNFAEVLRIHLERQREQFTG